MVVAGVLIIFTNGWINIIQSKEKRRRTSGLEEWQAKRSHLRRTVGLVEMKIIYVFFCKKKNIRKFIWISWYIPTIVFLWYVKRLCTQSIVSLHVCCKNKDHRTIQNCLCTYFLKDSKVFQNLWYLSV